jgi:hypothetical protein
MEDGSDNLPDPKLWKVALIRDFERVVHRDRWGRALMAIGWVHLAFFLVCQAVYTSGDRAAAPIVALWFAELVAVLVTLRRLLGPGWYRSSPMAGIVVRVWVTFLILSFNAASMNKLMGPAADWFKPSWTTLSSFGFATMAWLFGLRLLIPAFQMYFTGLLMVKYPHLNYLIYGLSWCVALQGIGLSLERRRSHASRPDVRHAPLDRETVAA